jgi:alkanesulfonate monooxygenase SsuD/methylene tetrahydromethanopterin reductase-like flavin-dependent oxidoreductase (luciferase family)
VELGYALSSEEHAPSDLVRHARAAEEAGFGFGLISDHIHPWVDAQGHSPFVWSVLGSIAHATEDFRIGTGVTCPLIRIHRRSSPTPPRPSRVSCRALLPRRRNGREPQRARARRQWPAPDERLEMLEEAVEVMRCSGRAATRRTAASTTRLRTFGSSTSPTSPSKSRSQRCSRRRPSWPSHRRRAHQRRAERGDHRDLRRCRRRSKPKYGQITVCYAESKDEAKRLALEKWPNALVEGSASQELPLPSDFEQLVEGRDPDELEGTLTLGPDPDEYLDQIRRVRPRGLHARVLPSHRPDQDVFLEFARNELFVRV